MDRNFVEQHIRILLIGNSGVGKTSIMARFVNEGFTVERPMTIGVTTNYHRVSIDGKEVQLEILDAGGQVRYNAPIYYRNANGAILVYDICDKGSFWNISSWLDTLETNCTKPDVVKLLVGNKIDLEDYREVTTNEGKLYADRHGMLFTECSAKTAEGVEEAFLRLVQMIMNTLGDRMSNVMTNEIETIRLEDYLPRGQRRKCCLIR